jgi:hypothetical protein
MLARRVLTPILLILMLRLAACSQSEGAPRHVDATQEETPQTLFPDGYTPLFDTTAYPDVASLDTGDGGPDASGPSSDTSGPSPDSSTPPQDVTPTDLGPTDVSPDQDASDASEPPSYCKPGTAFVYVVNQESHLLRFDPIPKTFTDIGAMTCESGFFAATPFSMSIDRDANAWVLYGNGKLYKVSTADASCAPANFAVGQHGFTTFGMGFTADGVGAASETLYVSNAIFGSGASTLGTITMPSLTLSVIGSTPAGIGSAELTGNGLGELWAFFPNGSRVAQLDKTTAGLSNQIDLPANVISDARAWAFAFWGGDFYLFFAGQWDSSSSVYRVKKDGTFETWMSNTGWNITGAGVSSCAPTG